MDTKSLSIVVPTYKEAESLPLLIDRLDALRKSQSLDLELLIMDDNSQDGTRELIDSKALPWVRLVVRTSNRGLSPSVIDGLRLATKDILVVMDADLSHPPERIPDLVTSLEQGNEFIVGSRYVPGASTDEAWGVFRWLNSKVATILARPFTRLADPMSGFFALRRGLLDKADPLNPIGYKIGLELLVKCRVTRAAEVPIHFAQRQKGESKLSFKEQIRYIQHLWRLFNYRYPAWSHAVLLTITGIPGLLVHLGAWTVLSRLRTDPRMALSIAVGLGMATMSALLVKFTASRPRSMIGGLAGFLAGGAAGYSLTAWVAGMRSGGSPWMSVLAGIAVAVVANYAAATIVSGTPAPAVSAAPPVKAN